MAKRKKTYRKSSKCPEPFNTLIDLAGAAALSAIVHSQIKRDYAKGKGDASAKAALAVYGAGALKRGSAGTISLGGLIGLNSALKDIERRKSQGNILSNAQSQSHVNGLKVRGTPPLRKNLWRDYCEDGSVYGLDPSDFSSPDEYNDALVNAKSKTITCQIIQDDVESAITPPTSKKLSGQCKDIWRKYCSDGSAFGIDPQDYSCADDYEDAIVEAKEKSS